MIVSTRSKNVDINSLKDRKNKSEGGRCYIVPEKKNRIDYGPRRSARSESPEQIQVSDKNLNGNEN